MIQTSSKFSDVPALDEVVDDFVIPNGELWEIRKFQGSASYLDDTAVSLVWDPAGAAEILACTHGDSSYNLGAQVTGDGTKVLRLVLSNDTNVARIMGGAWEARKL